MRTIIKLPDDQLAALDAICRRDNISRAEAIRRAVARHVRLERTDPDRAFGLWRKRPVDGVRHQRRLRAEWDQRGR